MYNYAFDSDLLTKMYPRPNLYERKAKHATPALLLRLGIAQIILRTIHPAQELPIVHWFCRWYLSWDHIIKVGTTHDNVGCGNAVKLPVYTAGSEHTEPVSLVQVLRVCIFGRQADRQEGR